MSQQSNHLKKKPLLFIIPEYYMNKNNRFIYCSFHLPDVTYYCYCANLEEFYNIVQIPVPEQYDGKYFLVSEKEANFQGDFTI